MRVVDVRRGGARLVRVGFSDSSLVAVSLDAERGLLYYTDKVQGIIGEITVDGVRRRKLFSDRTRHPRAVLIDSYTRYRRRHRHYYCHQAAKSVAALLMVARVTAGLPESNGSLPPRL